MESIKEDPQDRVRQRIVEHIVRVPVPTVQEQMIVPEIPGTRVVERIQEQIVESTDQEELDQLRNDWLMGEFELENDEDGRRERKPSRKIVNRTRF